MVMSANLRFSFAMQGIELCVCLMCHYQYQYDTILLVEKSLYERVGRGGGASNFVSLRSTTKLNIYSC